MYVEIKKIANQGLKSVSYPLSDPLGVKLMTGTRDSVHARCQGGFRQGYGPVPRQL
jgi:hypothetical protein